MATLNDARKTTLVVICRRPEVITATLAIVISCSALCTSSAAATEPVGEFFDDVCDMWSFNSINISVYLGL